MTPAPAHQSFAGKIALLAVALLSVAGCAGNDETPFKRSDEQASSFNAQLGANYMRSGDLERADEKLRKALEQDPRNADAHATYALLSMRLDEPERARDHFETALDLRSDDPDLQNNYGTFLCAQGDYEEGIEQFVQAAENRLYRTPAYAYANAGLCARDAGEPDAARRYFRQALEIDPRLSSVLLERADLELEQGQPGRAKEFHDRYNEVAEPTAASLWLGVRIERALGNPSAARAHGVKLLRNFRDSREAERFLETR